MSSVRNLVAENSEFYEEAASSSSEDEAFPNAWLTEENETVEMAALVPFRLRSELQNMYGCVIVVSASGVARKWAKSSRSWRGNVVEGLLDRRGGARKQKPDQDGSNRVVDPYDCCICAIHELCAKMNRRET